MTRWHKQDQFYRPEKNEWGNCAQAAIASYMGLSLDEVPHWAGECEGDPLCFWEGISEWFGARGYFFWHAPSNFTPPGLYLVSGQSPRDPKISHMVVFRDGILHHDPHPDGSGIVGQPRSIYVAIPFDPANQNLTSNRLSFIRKETEE